MGVHVAVFGFDVRFRSFLRGHGCVYVRMFVCACAHVRAFVFVRLLVYMQTRLRTGQPVHNVVMLL